MKQCKTIAVVLAIACLTWGCGSSSAEHEIKPLAARPPATSDFTKLSTPEEKIQFIQNSKAPDSEKKKAIERVKAGQL